MLDKRDFINVLYVISFPVYGIGEYVSAAVSPSIGYIFGISIHLLIIVFYGIDLLLKYEFSIKVNWIYLLMTAMQLACVAALYVAWHKNMPGTNEIGFITKSILLVIPFHAFIAVLLYNSKHQESFARLTFLSFSLLILINVIGFYGLGLTNKTHNIEGRVAFPFLDGFYSAACLLAIVNLMLLYYIKHSVTNPWRLTYLIGYFLINLVLLYLINSRLTLLIFLGVIVLFVVNRSGKFRGLFLISIFTVPILLNMGLLLYKILNLPVFVFLLKRVNLVDVATFNGRAFLWQRALDWLWEDQRGLFFGNGANGQYFLHLVADLAVHFGVKEENTHLHSTVLMTVVDQGLFGYLLLMLISYRVFLYYKNEYKKNSPDAIFCAVIVFILFVMQVDSFVYLGNSGYVILCILTARIAVNLKPT